MANQRHLGGRPLRSAIGPPWHVAHVIGHLRTGGAERQLVNYLLAADRQEFKHTVLCLEDPGELADTIRSSGIEIVKIPVRTRSILASAHRYAQWFRANDVAVLHAHMHHAALFSRLGAIWAGVPVILTTEHGKELWKAAPRLAVDHLLSRATARHICVSNENVAVRRRRERIASQKLVVVPNGVPIPDLENAQEIRTRIRREFGFESSHRIVGTVGRFIEAKGYEHMLAALELMRREDPRVKWLAVGDGELLPRMQALAVGRALDDSVIWAGRRSDVTDLILAMDVWLMSSVREGLPVALLEAMACGVPIVATSVGGIPDAVRNGQEAILVPAANCNALAKAVAALLRDVELAHRLGSSARERARECYSIDSVARQIERIYRVELARLQGGSCGED